MDQDVRVFEFDPHLFHDALPSRHGARRLARHRLGSASAQSVYLETYADPVPIVERYQVGGAPRYVVRAIVIRALPVVRGRTIVLGRRALLKPPMPPAYVVADWQAG